MDFLFEVKYKNGKPDKITISIKTSSVSDAIKELHRVYSDVASQKLLSQSPSK
jgi:hypothetical protein